jgi:hypothetical protein
VSEAAVAHCLNDAFSMVLLLLLSWPLLLLLLLLTA